MSSEGIAVFGGSFDPIHVGHTHVAADAAERLGVKQVLFIPARRSPLKTQSPRINDAHRVRLIELAIAEIPRFRLETCELRRPAPSYTIHTLRYLRAEQGPATPLYWLIGADAVATLAQWCALQELCTLCTIATMVRAGCPAPDFSVLEEVIGADAVGTLQQHVLATPAIPVSSTEVRRRLMAGEPTDGLLHPAVRAYIDAHGLYR